MLAKNKKFRNTSISLDGGTFEGCEFENCELTFSGYMPVQLTDCTFGQNIQWTFSGPASTTVSFMKALYAMGATEIIENAFEQIRGKPPKSGAVLH
jgi:hypothetical protein